MKIALVRARYNPYGGAERFAARARAALAADRAQAFEIAVLARRWDDVEAGGSVIVPRLIRCDPFYVGSVWRDASFAAAVHRRLADERFDLVQSHERIAGLPIYRAGDGVHASWLERRARAGGNATRLAIALNPHHRYLLKAERAMFEHPSLQAVICNSEMVRREIRERFAIDGDKLVLIRNGVDLDRFDPKAADVHRDALRARLQIPDHATVFTMVGSGFERKGVGLALLGLRDCPDAVLAVVGDDKHHRRYEADAVRLGVAGRVRFAGGVADPLPWFAMADFYLAPTLYDPFPNAVLEALACGLPVITTDACGGAELIAEDVSGWVLSSGDAEAAAVAMQIAVATDASRRSAMAAAARRAAEPYSLAALSTALTVLYRSLLQGR
ncbi:MAG: glycosyltransferase family 4 protein [Burkholderiaceae bacterium]